MWRVELEEILEVAQVDSEQWVSMLAEMMRTIPSTGSFNDEISENDENRRIFSDLVNDLRKLVRKNVDLGMLPLECHYLNKSALVSVVGQQVSLFVYFCSNPNNVFYLGLENYHSMYHSSLFDLFLLDVVAPATLCIIAIQCHYGFIFVYRYYFN
ncbi:hypothetical protein J6590_004538 [Homalodisca vitripennis]|nr:hypothetical protein J6590_004538 [Homalodisca vitripennis]